MTKSSLKISISRRLFCIRCNFPTSIFVRLGYAGWYYWLRVTKGSFLLTGGVVSLLRSCFPVGEFYLREVLCHNSGRVASFFRRFSKFFSKMVWEEYVLRSRSALLFYWSLPSHPEGGGVLLGLLGGGVPPGYSNPDPISEQRNAKNYPQPFSD